MHSQMKLCAAYIIHTASPRALSSLVHFLLVCRPVSSLASLYGDLFCVRQLRGGEKFPLLDFDKRERLVFMYRKKEEKKCTKERESRGLGGAEEGVSRIFRMRKLDPLVSAARRLCVDKRGGRAPYRVALPMYRATADEQSVLAGFVFEKKKSTQTELLSVSSLRSSLVYSIVY